jgi:Zn-dependent protease with chaperone function
MEAARWLATGVCLAVASSTAVASSQAGGSEIVTAGRDAAEERETLHRALRLLPRRPVTLAVIDADEAGPDVRPRLQQLDAFATTGGQVVYVTRHSPLLRGARLGSQPHLAALAAVIWHEMAHVAGRNEVDARRAEQELWTRFLRDGLLDPVTGLRYLEALRKRPHDPSLALR